MYKIYKMDGTRKIPIQEDEYRAIVSKNNNNTYYNNVMNSIVIKNGAGNVMAIRECV